MAVNEDITIVTVRWQLSVSVIVIVNMCYCRFLWAAIYDSRSAIVACGAVYLEVQILSLQMWSVSSIMLSFARMFPFLCKLLERVLNWNDITVTNFNYNQCNRYQRQTTTTKCTFFIPKCQIVYQYNYNDLRVWFCRVKKFTISSWIIYNLICLILWISSKNHTVNMHT